MSCRLVQSLGYVVHWVMSPSATKIRIYKLFLIQHKSIPHSARHWQCRQGKGMSPFWHEVSKKI